MNARRKRRSSRHGLVRAVVLIGISAVLLYLLGLFLMVVWYNFRNPDTSAFMRETLIELRATNPHATLVHEWVPYAGISINLKRAVIASEDSTFVENDGVNWDAIREAWLYNQRQKRRGSDKRRGGSTITQQLAKNLFLSSSRTYLRKGQELILAYMINAIMSKRRILELYLNLAQWGDNLFGAQAAARRYYHIDASRLSQRQAAQLAVMLPDPDYFGDHRSSSYLQRRTNVIEQRMRLVDIPGVH
ncbi:MAG TPA: monofunctional biosynthetic peptidoglycan transglycosylase [Burkholderiaceae bacterium]|nr:monofunctional biosynthetic peptidoglycan transglycosylase [Burkholderiaceae bacterium]